VDERYELKLLDKVFDVIECFTLADPEHSLTDLQKKLNIHKATLYRILVNLEHRGYIQKSKHSGKYQLGAKFVSVANVCLSTFDLRTVAQPYIKALAQQTGETVIINVRQGYHGICIERINSLQPVKITADIGRKVPLLRGASGKILAAYCGEQQLAAIYEKEKKDLSVTFGDICRQMEEIRRKGYAISFQELDRDTAGVSFPIWDAAGEVVAGLSVIGPLYRFGKGSIPLLLRYTAECAAQISGEMGYSAYGATTEGGRKNEGKLAY